VSQLSATDSPPASLWRNRAFLRLWIAQVVSNAGTKVTGLALPLTAVLVLHATPGQMALLIVAGQIPNFLFGLFAGVWVDRTRRRPILVSTDPAIAAEVLDLVGGEFADQLNVFGASQMEVAVAFANDFAAEHLTLACVEPERWLPRVSAAGSVFLGPFAPAAAGAWPP